jgi:hypothetical protein
MIAGAGEQQGIAGARDRRGFHRRAHAHHEAVLPGQKIAVAQNPPALQEQADGFAIVQFREQTAFRAGFVG